MKLAPRLKTLDGIRLGFLDNRKQHADVFVKELRKSICALTSPRETRSWTKTSVYGALSKRVMREITSECDALVFGPCDCGHGSASCLRDIFELEAQGIPVAWVDTPGRVPHVERKRGVFAIDYATNFMIERAVQQRGLNPKALARTFEKFGFHRALRLAGAQPGDRIRIGTVELELWPYPDAELQSSTDGVLDYPYTVLEAFRRTSASELRAAAQRLAPQVISALTKPARASSAKRTANADPG